MSEKTTVETMPRGARGFIDSYYLVEGEANRDNMAMPTEAQILGREPMPVYVARTGRFYVKNRAEVLATSDPINRVPIEKSKGGHLTIDFTSDLSVKLNSPVRLLNASAIQNEDYLMCEVEGLDEALKVGPPESAASLKAEADARLAAEAKAGKKPVAV